MKKVILSIAAASLLLGSCGKSEVCSCVDTTVNMMKDAKDAKGDMTKLKELEEKYKADVEKCEKLVKADKKKFEEEGKKCDGYKEIEKMMKQ